MDEIRTLLETQIMFSLFLGMAIDVYEQEAGLFFHDLSSEIIPTTFSSASLHFRTSLSPDIRPFSPGKRFRPSVKLRLTVSANFPLGSRCPMKLRRKLPDRGTGQVSLV